MEAQWLLRRHKSHLPRKAVLLSTLKYQNRPESGDLIEKVKVELQTVQYYIGLYDAAMKSLTDAEIAFVEHHYDKGESLIKLVEQAVASGRPVPCSMSSMRRFRSIILQKVREAIGG